MNAEGHARFAAAQGMKTVRCGDHLWATKQAFCLESVPPHRRIHVREQEARQLFRRGYLVLRYTCDEPEGVRSNEYICDERPYGFDSLEGKTRNQVRQGLKNCAVRPIDYQALHASGCAINCSVFERQKRTGPAFLRDQLAWQRYLN